MSVPPSRRLLVIVAAVFSAYQLLLAAVSIEAAVRAGPYIVAMVLYAVATMVSLWPTRSNRMPIGTASLTVAVSVAVAILVTGELPEGPGDGYAAWHTGAIGTLMVITSIRRRQSQAWIGVGALAVQTVAGQGFSGLLEGGALGTVIWVAISHALVYSLASADRDARHYALAEREAAEWRAAQEAHVFERQFRLGQTRRMAVPMLREIVARGGDLPDAQREECLHLEEAIRDEIRGRKLLNDRVRHEVMAARRRGMSVTLLDEGGIDDVFEEDLDRVLNRLAEAIGGSAADRIIARTVPHGTGTAVTVIGLSADNDGTSSALGQHCDDDDAGDEEIELWLEIPRVLSRSPRAP